VGVCAGKLTHDDVGEAIPAAMLGMLAPLGRMTLLTTGQFLMAHKTKNK